MALCMIDSVSVLYNYTNWSYSLVVEEWEKIQSQFFRWAEPWFITLLLGLIQYDILDASYWCKQAMVFAKTLGICDIIGWSCPEKNPLQSRDKG